MPILMVVLASIFFDKNAVCTTLLTELGGLMDAQGSDTLKAIIAGAKRADEGLAASIIPGVIVLVTANSAFAELKESVDESRFWM